MTMKTLVQMVAICLVVVAAFAVFGLQSADAGYGYGYSSFCYPTYNNFCYPSYVPTYCNPYHYSLPFHRCW